MAIKCYEEGYRTGCGQAKDCAPRKIIQRCHIQIQKQFKIKGTRSRVREKRSDPAHQCECVHDFVPVFELVRLPDSQLASSPTQGSSRQAEEGSLSTLP
jgi:hypothetical protein